MSSSTGGKGRAWTRDPDGEYRMVLQVRTRITVDEVARILNHEFGPLVLGVERDDRTIITGLMVDDGIVHVREVRDAVQEYVTHHGTDSIANLPAASGPAIESAAAIYSAPTPAWRKPTSEN